MELYTLDNGDGEELPAAYGKTEALEGGTRGEQVGRKRDGKTMGSLIPSLTVRTDTGYSLGATNILDV